MAFKFDKEKYIIVPDDGKVDNCKICAMKEACKNLNLSDELLCIEATGGVQHHFEEKGNKPPVRIELLFSDDVVHLEKVDNNYRLSFFNKNNHWAGDITFSKEGKIINNDLHD